MIFRFALYFGNRCTNFQGVMSFKDNDLDLKMGRSECDRFNALLDHES